MPGRGDEIIKRKDGRFMARVTVQTPNDPKRETVYSRKYSEAMRLRDLARGEAAKGIVYED